MRPDQHEVIGLHLRFASPLQERNGAQHCVHDGAAWSAWTNGRIMYAARGTFGAPAKFQIGAARVLDAVARGVPHRTQLRRLDDFVAVAAMNAETTGVLCCRCKGGGRRVSYCADCECEHELACCRCNGAGTTFTETVASVRILGAHVDACLVTDVLTSLRHQAGDVPVLIEHGGTRAPLIVSAVDDEWRLLIMPRLDGDDSMPVYALEPEAA